MKMASHFTSPPIGAATLQKLLTDVDPGALLVSPRLLRRVIKQDRQIGGVGLQVPHRKPYTLGRDALRCFARPLLHRYFPCVEDLGVAEAVLAEVVDAPKLFAETRLAGAPDPVMHAHDLEDEPGESDDRVHAPRGMPSASKCQKLLAR